MIRGPFRTRRVPRAAIDAVLPPHEGPDLAWPDPTRRQLVLRWHDGSGRALGATLFTYDTRVLLRLRPWQRANPTYLRQWSGAARWDVEPPDSAPTAST